MLVCAREKFTKLQLERLPRSADRRYSRLLWRAGESTRFIVPHHLYFLLPASSISHRSSSLNVVQCGAAITVFILAKEEDAMELCITKLYACPAASGRYVLRVPVCLHQSSDLADCARNTHYAWSLVQGRGGKPSYHCVLHLHRPLVLYFPQPMGTQAVRIAVLVGR